MKRTYSKEFKRKACELVEKDNIAVSVVAERFGINHVMLHRWVSEYREYGEEAFVGKGHQRPADAEFRKAIDYMIQFLYIPQMYHRKCYNEAERSVNILENLYH